ncbi:MAG: FecR family protein [Gallionella sp.]|nr:FecR family protein [Gallionella sp.]
MKRMILAGVILGITVTGCSNDGQGDSASQENSRQSQVILTDGATSHATGVGKVAYKMGSLLARRADGTVKVMETEANVQAGDVLGTSKDSYALIQMNDGARMTLLPNSNLKIVDYRFNKDAPQLDSAVFNLLKGGLRSVTGLIGKRGNIDAYRMQTSMATIGIRGTDFSSRLCATPNCQDDVDAPAKLTDKQPTSGGTPATTPADSPPGLYVTVHDGKVIVAQPTGSALSLERGETGFADVAALAKLPEPPAFMNVDTKQTDAIEANNAAADTTQQAPVSSSDNKILLEIRKQDRGERNLCLLTYMANKSSDTRYLNLFAIRLEGEDGTERNPSIMTNKDPVFPFNKELEPGTKALGWICFDIPSATWKPSAIDFKDIMGDRIIKHQF